MEHLLRSLMRVRPLIAVTAAVLLTSGVVLLTGCGGGSSQSVISTGFPQGAGPFTLTTPGSGAGGSLTLSASNVPSAVFFPAPRAVADADATGCASDVCTSSTSGPLSLIPGTVYQLQNPTQPKGGRFPGTVTLTIAYPSAVGHDLNTLNVYYFDGKSWQAVPPSAGNFQSVSGQIRTTLTTIYGIGLYAVMSSAPPATPSAS